MKPQALLAALPLLALSALPCRAEDTAAQPIPRHVSLKLEIEDAYSKGVRFLQSTQSENGTWSNAELPALTALPLRAIAGDPNRKPGAPLPEWTAKSVAWILSTQKPDGGYYVQRLGSYNTAICMMALLAVNDPAHHPSILKARQYLVAQQHDFDTKGKDDNPMDGGLGYGSHPVPDLSNTNIALEALAKTRKLYADSGEPAAKDLDWDAALRFVSRCQNLPESNDQAWAQSVSSEDHGGFVYSPVESKAGETQQPGGKTGLRSYGSMSYAGLLSMVYAEVGPEDPRVKAVVDWLSRNWQLKENPNMGAEGLFYYYHTMAKALVAANLHTLPAKDGPGIAWKEELAVRLFDLQQPDGSWTNTESKRWMEGDPALVTAYSLLALAHIYHSL